MVDDKLERDEIQRSAELETVKADIGAEVRNEVAIEADRAAINDRADVKDLAAEMRGRAVDQVAETEREVQRGRFAARLSQVVDYVFLLIYGLLAIRLLLELFAARKGAPFFQFIQDVTGPFYAPFRGIVASPSTPEGFTLALPIVVAIVAYMLLHLAINGLLRIVAHRKVEV